jgi:hypothetical protein
MLGSGQHEEQQAAAHTLHQHGHNHHSHDASSRKRALLGPALQIMRLACGSETITTLLLHALKALSWRNSCAPLSAVALPMAGSYPFLATATALLAADKQLRGVWADQPAAELQQQLEELLSRKLPSMEDLTELIPQVGVVPAQPACVACLCLLLGCVSADVAGVLFPLVRPT